MKFLDDERVVPRCAGPVDMAGIVAATIVAYTEEHIIAAGDGHGVVTQHGCVIAAGIGKEAYGKGLR